MTGNSAVEESELRCVAYDLGSEWETVATHLGCTLSDIQKYKMTRHNQDINLAIFDMLISWKRRHPEDNQRHFLLAVLEQCNRQDIAHSLTTGAFLETAIQSPPTCDLNVEQCREDLRWTYLNDVCRLPIYPWEKSHCIGIEDIFTNLSIILDLPHPFRSLKIPLPSYEEIFTYKTTGGNLSNRVIVQGEAGTGKSTLSAKFAYDWAKEKDTYLRSKKLLFLLRMRDLELSTNLEDAILSHLLPKDTSITSYQLRKYLDQHSEDCCLILDGYDESWYQSLIANSESGNIASILRCETLRKCLVIVTSRPERLVEFEEHRKHYTNYEVTGFSEDEVEFYIRKFFGYEDIAKANDLLEFIESNSMKIGMASTPLVTHLLCLYWKHMDNQDGDEDGPTTMTKLQNALFNFMHDHYAAKGTSLSSINLEELILQLGEIALKALWPPSSRLVFTEEEVVQKTSQRTVTDACNLGILSTQGCMSSSQGRSLAARGSGSLTRSDIRARTIEKKKVEFFHKLGQEHCAGHYLANLAEKHPLEFDEQMNCLHKPRDALTLSFVLLSACGNSWKCAEGVMSRLNVIYFAEIWRHMNRFIRGKLGGEESRNIQQFIELCIQCNLESEAAGRHNYLLLKLFPWKKIVFTGMPAQTAVALRYFLQHMKNPEDIEHLFVNGVPRKGMDFINDSTFETLSENLLQKYDQAASRLNEIELERTLQGLELPSKGDLAKTQLYQEFEKWEVETPSSVFALLDRLDCVSLKTLNLRHLCLAEKSQRLFEVIGSGGLSSLTHLDLANTGLENDQVLQLAVVVSKLHHLKDIILFSNKAEDGLVELSKGFSALSLRWIDLSLMQASVGSMKCLCDDIPQFGKGLDALHLDGNEVDDACLESLTVSLPMIRRLQRLSISPSAIENSKSLESFLESLELVPELEAFQITVVSSLSSVLLQIVSKTMRRWRQLKDLLLGCVDDEIDSEGNGEVEDSACEQFLTALDDVKNLQWLDLVKMRLSASGFDALVKICKRHNYKRLQSRR